MAWTVKDSLLQNHLLRSGLAHRSARRRPSMPQPSPELPAPAGSRSPGAALAVLSAGTLMIILDGTIVNVALPSIQHDLGFSQAGLAWVVNAYLIAFGGLLLLTGRLGDLLGRRRILVAGLT